MKFILAALASVGLIFAWATGVALGIFQIGSPTETFVFYGSQGTMLLFLLLGVISMTIERREMATYTKP